jgi:hypothetical protein
VLDCLRTVVGRGEHSGGLGFLPGLGSLKSLDNFAMKLDIHGRTFNEYRELQQLLDSGDRGDRAADDDCLRSLLLLRGLPSRS